MEQPSLLGDSAPGDSAPVRERDFREVLAEHGKTLTVDGRGWTGDKPPVDPAPYMELEKRVFAGSGEALARLREFAAFRGLNPVSLLVNVCVAVCSCIPPRVVGDIGLGDLNLNLFVVNYGAPGLGKGRLTRAAEEYARVCLNETEIRPTGVAPGSGEGICRMATFDEEGNQRATLIETGEITDVKAKGGRQGSTLRPTLLAAYSGERLGAYNKDTNAGDLPEKDSYRLCFMLGSQEDTAGYFFEGGSDGFIDRFIATEAINPNDGALTVTVEPRPVPLSLKLPENSRVVISFPREIVEYARANQRAKNCGYDDVEGAGHALETRAKLTVALALFHSRLYVTHDDWGRAGAIMDYSRWVFAKMKTHLERQETTAKAKRRIADDEAREQASQARWDGIAEKILEPVRNGGEARWTGKGGVLQQWNSKRRDEVATVFQDLIDNDTIQIWQTNEYGGVNYTLASG